MSYDSRPDTIAHIVRVREFMGAAVQDIQQRAMNHDQSKMHDPELETWDRMTPRLEGVVYGSDEYKANLVELGPALEHHYQHNDHHPEHHVDGVAGMTLMSLVEMLCDWRASSERTAPRVGQTFDERFRRSLEQNAERFGIDPQLQEILQNTALALGFYDIPEEV